MLAAARVLSFVPSGSPSRVHTGKLPQVLASPREHHVRIEPVLERNGRHNQTIRSVILRRYTAHATLLQELLDGKLKIRGIT